MATNEDIWRRVEDLEEFQPKPVCRISDAAPIRTANKCQHLSTSSAERGVAIDLFDRKRMKKAIKGKSKGARAAELLQSKQIPTFRNIT
jgi:hypothetical protein